MDLIRRLCAAIITSPFSWAVRFVAWMLPGTIFEAGITRLIIITMALEEPDEFQALCAAYPGRIGVSLDARDGRLKTKGWVADF